MVIPILFVAGILTQPTRRRSTGGALALIGPFAGASRRCAGIMLVGHFVLRPLLHLGRPHRQPRPDHGDYAPARGGPAGTTALAGLSIAFGAFLAGLLLSDSQYAHQIEIDLEPFKGLLLGLFFITVGMMLDRSSSSPPGLVILAGLVVLFIVKAVGTLCRGARYSASLRSTAAELRCCCRRPANSPSSSSVSRGRGNLLSLPSRRGASPSWR